MDVTAHAFGGKIHKRLLRFDGGPDSGFRLKVTAGGCSGLAADFSVEAAPQGRCGLEVGGIKLFLPAESRLLLDGVTVDFAETPRNPASFSAIRSRAPAALRLQQPHRPGPR